MRNNAIERIIKQVKQKRLIKRAISLLSIAVILVTFNSTKFMADTLERLPDCGYEYDHQHGPECYDASGELVCQLHVHTDACYQTRPVSESMEAAEPADQPVEEAVPVEEVASEPVEAAVEEVEIQLGEDGEESPEINPVEAGEWESYDAESTPEALPLYYVGDQYPFFLSDVLKACDLDIPLAEVVEIGQVLDTDDAPQTLRFERIEDDYVIYTVRDCEDQELAIMTDTDLMTVRLIDSVVPQWVKEEQAAEAEAGMPTVEPAEDVMAGQMEEVEETTAPVEAVETVKAENEDAIAETTVEKAEDAKEDVETEKAEDGDKVSEAESEENKEAEETDEAEQTVKILDVEAVEPQVEEIKETEVGMTEESEETEETEVGEEIAVTVAGEMKVPETAEETGTVGETEAEEAEEANEKEEAGQPAEGESDEETHAAADNDISESRKLIIDLSKVESFPLSLNAMLAQLQAASVVSEEALTETASVDVASMEEAAGNDAVENIGREDEAVEAYVEEVGFELGEEPAMAADAGEVSGTELIAEKAAVPAIAYDSTLLTVEPSGDDYLITPVAPFERTDIVVDDTFTIQLQNSQVESVAVAMPAQSFAGETEYVAVSVEAAEGAFPAGTSMSLVDVDDEDKLASIGDAAVGEGFSEVQRVHAVDIVFKDADGNEIEPRIPISVVMIIRETEQDEDTVVVHMDDDGNAQVVQDTTVAPFEATDDSIEDWSGAMDAPVESIAFQSDAFSVYAVVVTRKLETRFITAEGETYEITVTYAEDAAIPVGATLEVREIEDESAQDYLDQAADVVDRQITMARFFDIKIWDGDHQIEPAAPVSVVVRLLDVPQESDTVPAVVHFAKAGPEVMEVTETAAADMADASDAAETEIQFTTGEFSVYGVFKTKEAEDVAGKIGRTTADNVAIREKSNSLSTTIGTIPEKGTRLTLLGTADGILGGLFSHWYQIEYTDEAGTVYNGYVEQDSIEIVVVVEAEPVDYDTFTAVLSYEAGVLREGAALAVNAAALSDETVAAYRTLIESLLVTGDGNKGALGEIKDIEFFDLSVMVDGAEVQPDGEVRVGLSLKNPIPLNAGETLRVIHFTSADEATVLPKDKVELTTDENGAVTRVSFLTKGFSTYALATVIEKDFIASDGTLYHVTVTYGKDAQLPTNATLSISEFDENSDKYAYARKAVLADIKARNEWVDLSSFSLAALDISILDENGNEIEPAAPVQVNLTIVGLPGVEDLSEVTDTLAIQHHVETEDGVVIERVAFNGGLRAEFERNTKAAVLESGREVHPDSFSEDVFVMPEEDADEDDIDVSFQTPVFSTFTVTWGTPNSEEYRKNLNGKSFVLVNESHNAALVAENINNNTRLKAVQYSPSDESITKWHFQQINNWSFYITDGNGHYLNIGNGNNSYVSVSDTPQAIYIDRNNNNRFRLQRSSDTYSTALNLYGGNLDGGFGPYNDRGENEWFRAYYPLTGDTARIHYVDEGGNELTVSNGSISSSTLLNNYAYLIYDIEGGEYEYKETYINTPNSKIRAFLRGSNSRWQYCPTDKDPSQANSWSNVSDNDNIYVVYKEKVTPTNGGTPTLVELDDDEKPEQPKVTKDSKVNGDGTNTLSLSVTSHTRPREVLKLADVIVIFDRSGSMGQEISSDNDANDTSKQRMTLLKKAVGDLAESLIGNDSEYIYTDKEGTKHKQIEMSLVSFSTTATNASAFTDDAEQFKGWVNTLTPEGGTNWEQALQKANEAAVDSGRATFVIFVTDGEPTFRMTRMTDDDSDLDNDIYFPNNYTYYGTYYRDNNVYGTGYSDERKDGTNYGRNYRAALAQAMSIVGKNKNLYMIGVGPEVGNLEQFNTDAGGSGYYSATDADSLTSAFESIKKDIAALAGYSDFQISDGITDLTQTVQKSTLVSFVDDDFTYYKGHAATAEDVANGLATAEGETVWVSWTPGSEKCEEAVYDTSTGAVVWNMGDDFMPQEGYTYQVRFKVWPSQAAYDLLADLNNGVKNYGDLDDDVKEQIQEPESDNGIYTLKTNSETSYNYKDATVVNGKVATNGKDVLDPPGSFLPVHKLELSTTPLKIRKLWHNNYVDSRTLTNSITMQLYGVDPDGATSHDFKTITLSKYKLVDGHYVDSQGNALYYDEVSKTFVDGDGNEGTPVEAETPWYAENNYISYGLVTYDDDTNKGEKIYETGHEFTLRETDSEAHYYELTAGVYRPMYINNIPTMLELIDAAPSGMADDVFHYTDGTNHYYRLDDRIYLDTGSDILMVATNTHRSYMDITKTVTTEAGDVAVSDQLFEFEVTFTVPSNIDNFETEQYIFASVKDEKGNSLNHLTDIEKTEGFWVPSELAGKIGANVQYYERFDETQRIIVSGDQFTMKLKPGWTVRFVNLPNGTTYSIKEVNIPEGYEFVKAEVSGSQWIANMDPQTGADNGQPESMTGLPTDSSNSGVNGTITVANARYSTTYTNKTLTQHVVILKTSQDGTTPLPGAVFDLYTESGYNADPKTAAKTDLISDESGHIDLGGLPIGKYYLVETTAPAGYIRLTEPVEITVELKKSEEEEEKKEFTITYSQSGNSQSQNGSGKDYNTTTDTYTLTVTNNAGAKLPATGGPGTAVYTVSGISMIVLAAFLLLRKKERDSL